MKGETWPLYIDDGGPLERPTPMYHFGFDSFDEVKAVRAELTRIFKKESVQDFPLLKMLLTELGKIPKDPPLEEKP